MGTLREFSTAQHESAAKCLREQGSPFAVSLARRILKGEVLLYEVELPSAPEAGGACLCGLFDPPGVHGPLCKAASAIEAGCVWCGATGYGKECPPCEVKHATEAGGKA